MTPIVTAIPNGNCVMTQMLGSRPKFILAYKGHELDRDHNIVNVRNWTPDDPRWESMGIQVPSPSDLALRNMGLYPVGIPPRKVVSKMRTWKEWSYLDDNGKTLEKRRLWVRRENTCLFPVMNFSYAFRMEGVETSMGFKVDIDFTVNVEGVNPQIALVDHDDWYMRFDGLEQGRARSYIGGKDVFELFTEEKGAQELLKYIHPLRIIRERREKEAADRGITLPPTNPFPPFNQYIAETTVMDEEEVSGVTTLVPKTLSKGLGIRVTDASIEDISISASEVKLLEEMSSIMIQDMANVNAKSAADTRNEITESTATAQASAMKKLTVSGEERWTKVDQHYAATPQGAELAASRVQADAAIQIAGINAGAMEKVAAAVGGSKTITTVVFPNSSAQPVVPVGKSA